MEQGGANLIPKTLLHHHPPPKGVVGGARGEGSIFQGGAKLMANERFQSLARSGSFELFKKLGPQPEGWRNFKLELEGQAPKNNWWFGWNGDRLVDNSDIANLSEHHREVVDWVVSTIRENA